MTRRATLFTLLLVAVFTTPARADSADAVLDALHAAGAASDPAGFFAQMTEDAVVLGLDGTGPLAGHTLRNHVDGRFAAGDAWGYRSTERAVRYSGDGNVAWFTESLENPGGGHSWGSGVLLRTGTGWKVAQYSVTVVTSSAGTGSARSSAAAGSGGGDTGSQPTETIEPAQQAESAQTSGAGQQERKRCRKMRHKTNRASSC
jgi:ketosteroid isomerase-like protein